MAQDSAKADGSSCCKDDAKSPKLCVSPWVLHFSLAAILTLVIAVIFQIQLSSLREELAGLKRTLSSGCDINGSRNLMKRNVEDSEDENRRSGEIGLEAVHLKGLLPFQHILKQGRIGPWSLSSTHDSLVKLRGKSTEVEITQPGIYYVYAQVYYLTSQPHNSYQILQYNGTEERKHHRNVATCSSQGRSSLAEISCYTGFVASFQAGDRLYLNQVEQDRIIHFTNGCSYLGLILIKKNGVWKGKKD